MADSFFCFLLVASLNLPAFSQSIKLDSLNFYPSGYATVDYQGNLYLGGEDGEILKLEMPHQKVIRYSGNGKILYSQVQAISNNQVLIFSKQEQGGIILDRYLNLIREINFGPAHDVYASCITLTPDHSLWMVDEYSGTLKKYRFPGMNLETEIFYPPLFRSQVLDIRNYQNRLFLLDIKGIHVFDMMGNPVHFFPAPETPFFYFLNNSMLFPDSTGLVIQSIHFPEQREHLQDAHPHGYLFFIQPDFSFHISPKEIIIEPADYRLE
jgi:hypothetical protein